MSAHDRTFLTPYYRKSAAAVVAAFLLAACGGSTGGSASPATPVASTQASAGDATPSAAEPEVGEFVYATRGQGFEDIAWLAAVEELRSQGWTIEVAQLADVELLNESLVRGDALLAPVGMATMGLLTQQGLPIKAVMSQVRNTVVLAVAADIQACADLDGRTIAINQENASSTVQVKSYIDTECPGIEPVYVVIPSSENRFAAMVAGEIDAAPLRLGVSEQLATETDGYHVIVSFAEGLPDLLDLLYAVNVDEARENPAAVQAFVTEVLRQHQLIATEDGYLAGLIEQFADVLEDTPSDAAIQEYLDNEVFPADGFLSPESVEYSIDWLLEAGFIEPGLTADDVADFTYIDAANSELGQ